MTLVRSVLFAVLIALALSARAGAGQLVQFTSSSLEIANVTLIVDLGAHDGYDVADLGTLPARGVAVQCHRLAYHEAATRDAAQQVRSFLDGALND